MMTRVLKILLPLLGGLFLSGLCGCSPHEFPDDWGDGCRVRLVFDETLPQYQVLHPATKGEGYAPRKVRYTAKLFRFKEASAYGLNPDYSFSFTRTELDDLDTTIVLPRMEGRFKLAVWADFVDEEDSLSWKPDDFERIVLAKDYRLGERERDAFCGTLDIDPDEVKRNDEPLTMTLRRPVAQIRFYLSNADEFLAEQNTDLGGLYVTFRYTAPIPDTYDLLRGHSSGARSGVRLSLYPEIDPFSGELVFFSDFILAEEEPTSVSVYFAVRDDDGEPYFTFRGDVPILRAHRTDVCFGPQDDDGSGGGVGIDPGFDGSYNISID